MVLFVKEPLPWLFATHVMVKEFESPPVGDEKFEAHRRFRYLLPPGRSPVQPLH